MIECYIDGQRAYPVIKDNIKLTRENPFVKDKESYTYDISFPLDIPENLRVFGPLNRIGVSIRRHVFPNCRLIVANRMVICGTGTITDINRNEVKMQILSGMSSVKYRSGFENVYIDRIPYMSVDEKYQPRQVWKKRMSIQVDVTEEIFSQGYVGDISKYVFMPVWDESNNIMANRIGNFDNTFTGSTTGTYETGSLTKLGLFYRAVQPNFMMVLRTVLEYMGYTIKENVYDVYPWNQLIIASARQTAIIAKALPHWSVAKFLEEFRKLFNAAYLFDEENHTVRVIRATAMNNQPIVRYEAIDEFEVSYDEDGLEYLGSSNLDYNLSESGSEVWKIPQEVLREFTVREYDTYSDMVADIDGMTEQEKMTTLFADEGGFLYFYEQEGVNSPVMKRTGFFSQLTRNSETDDTISLNIVPVCMENKKWEVWCAEAGRRTHNGQYRECYVPVVENPEVMDAVNLDDDEEERDYVTVADVIEAGISAQAEETEEDTRIELMWVCPNAGYKQGHSKFHYDNYLVGGDYYMPLCYTDFRFGPFVDYNSLALTHAVIYSIREQCHYVGQYHEEQIRINANSTIDAQDEHVFKFLSDTTPDPANIYMFYGKLYLCSKLETNITDDGTDQLITGYFYEML
ncbi:MAG: hypothetical protein IJS95_03120 [Prevotella sp.]|nr:hypothetical protein [Prevotella sp.]